MDLAYRNELWLALVPVVGLDVFRIIHLVNKQATKKG